MERKIKQTCTGMTEWSNQGQSGVCGNAAKDEQRFTTLAHGIAPRFLWTVFCIGGDWVDAEAAIQDLPLDCTPVCTGTGSDGYRRLVRLRTLREAKHTVNISQKRAF